MTEIIYRESFTVEDFLALVQRVWPRAYSTDDNAAALQRTINIGAWDGSRLVGCVRVLTDGHYFSTITEILVDPEYQRRGIGRALMHRALAAAPRNKLVFGAQPQSATFFQRIGCIPGLTGFVASLPLTDTEQ